MNYTRNGKGGEKGLLQYLSRVAVLPKPNQHRSIVFFVHDPVSPNAERPVRETVVQ